jgi:UDP-2,3-diacylglucosamine hydrolase
MNYTLFIADLHLQSGESEKIDLFVKFLTGKAAQADALYILGDFFEVWVGDDDNSAFINQIKTALKQFTSTGIPIYFMHGNRDFLIGKKFAQDTGIILINDPIRIDLYGTPTLLTHGDMLCTKDKGYMRYRKLVRNPKYQKLFLLLPLKLRRKIARYLRIKSTKIKESKPNELKNIDNRTLINLMQQYQVKQIIHGHIHKQGVFDNGTRISLGNWDNLDNHLILKSDFSREINSRSLYFV